MNVQGAAALGASPGRSEIIERNEPDSSTARPPTKRARVIARLLRGPATSFDLERDAHDHVASATISELKGDGLLISSRLVEVPGYAGELARIARYELDPASRDRAQELLRRTKRRRRDVTAT